MKKLIGETIPYKDAIHSTTAIKKGIDNTPGREEILAMDKLVYNIYEPLMAWFQFAIHFNSFYRSEELNKVIGGSKSSQHVKGQAIDLDDWGQSEFTNKEVFEFIEKYLDFDQLIWEFGDDDNPAWVHVSYVGTDDNRNNVLRARKIEGKTVYEKLR